MEPGDPRHLNSEEVDGIPREEGPERGSHLGYVAHEIRNPLSTALWTAELMARLAPQERGGARGEKLTAMCLRSIARVRQLVEDHFMSERLDVGGLALRAEPIAVRDAVEAVIGHRPPDAGPVEVRLEPTLAVDVDRGMLERAIDSLVAAAGTERTPVSVTAVAGEREVTVVVSGRPASDAALADPVKGDASDPTGRALALPLARRIADALGGALVATDGAWHLSLRRARSAGPQPAHPDRPAGP